jgi:hypothetical protein
MHLRASLLLPLLKHFKALTQVQNGAPGFVIAKKGRMSAHAEAAHQDQSGHRLGQQGQAPGWEQLFHL